jgi:hypothetical protein
MTQLLLLNVLFEFPIVEFEVKEFLKNAFDKPFQKYAGEAMV